MSTTKTQYKSNILNGSNYQTYTPQQKLLSKEGQTSIVLNSGYYPEDHNDIFKQLMLSQSVYVRQGDTSLPAVLKKSSIKYKTQLTDSLIDYQMEFDFAFATINDVR